MSRILLLRPGATDYDEQGRIKGSLDIPLSEKGSSQVTRVIEELEGMPIQIVFTSPCRSAVQTGEALGAACGAKIKRVEGLRNLNFGLWQGKLIEDVRQKQPKVYRQWQDHPENVSPPEGEMLSAAQERIRETLNALLRTHSKGLIAIVASEPLATIIRSHLQQSDLGDLWKTERACGSWELIESEPVQTEA
jgi:broad specificity phosphatase PhoE